MQINSFEIGACETTTNNVAPFYYRIMRSLTGRTPTQQVHPRAVSLKRFPEYCSYLLDIPGRLSSEFQLLASLSVDIKNMNSFNAGLLPDNKLKNRYVNIIPCE